MWKNLNLWKLALGISSAFVVAPLMHKAGHLTTTNVDTALFSSTGNLAVASDRAEEFDVWRDVFFFGGVGIGLHSVLGLKKGKAATVQDSVQAVSKPAEPVVVTVQPEPEPVPVTPPTPEPEDDEPEVEEEDFDSFEDEEEEVEPVAPPTGIWVPSFDLFKAMWEHPGHFGFVAGTQSGKTSTMLGFMDYTQQLDQPVYHFVVDPKMSRWGGLEKGSVSVGGRKIPFVTRVAKEDPQSIEKLYSLLRFIERIRCKRAKERYENNGVSTAPHIYVWLDEWPFLRKIGNRWDNICHQMAKTADPPEHYQRQMPDCLEEISGMFDTCAEDHIHIGFVTQNPLCKVTGFNTGDSANFAWIGLGREDQKGLENIFCNQFVIRSTKTRKQAMTELPKHVSDPTPTVYTSLKGHKMFSMPDLSHIKGKQIFTNPTQEN